MPMQVNAGLFVDNTMQLAAQNPERPRAPAGDHSGAVSMRSSTAAVVVTVGLPSRAAGTP